MKKLLLYISKPILGKKRHQSFLHKLHYWVLLAENFGQSAYIETSGEIYLLRLVKKYYSNIENLIFFDVGANIGEYSKHVLDLFQDSITLYSFEPAKSTFNKLASNLSSYRNAICCNIGLGNNSQKLTLYSNNVSSGQSSLFKRDMSHWNSENSLQLEEEVNIVDALQFCQNNHISYINFLKLDIEGNELNVIKSIKPMIDDEKVDFIQFEFGVCNVDSKVFFKDFYYLLINNYDLFRIVKNGLHPITEYNEINEIFLTINYFAVSHRISAKFLLSH